jgi:hypothetical protein
MWWDVFIVFIIVFNCVVFPNVSIACRGMMALAVRLQVSDGNESAVPNHAVPNRSVPKNRAAYLSHCLDHLQWKKLRQRFLPLRPPPLHPLNLRLLLLLLLLRLSVPVHSLLPHGLYTAASHPREW